MPTECVKVIVRMRPFNSREKENGSKPCVTVHEDTNSVELRSSQDNEVKNFSYDYVFGAETPQLQIYQKTAFNLVESVADGYNGTIFAYGQTGCGKTFTMIGDPTNENMKGIIPRTFDQIISIINNNSDSNKKFLLRCSYIEIYNEEIHDLLSKDAKQKYELKEGQQGVFIKDLNIAVVRTTQEMDKYMQLGTQNRSVGATAMNKESSRSHCIFTVYIECSITDSKGNERITAGKLNLVDLAGSERQSKTQATGDRLKEATKINLSLSALGNVISALVDGKTQHIPYRDSKLTRLLQDSLGGNTKTIMITAISPSDFNYDETLSSLRYASRAKMIKNQPKVNEDPKDALLKEQAEEIKKLKELLSRQAAGQPVSLEAFQQFSRPDDNSNAEIFRLKEENDRLMREKQGLSQPVNSEEKLKELHEFKEKNNLLQQEKDKFEQEMREKEQQAEQERQARQRLEQLLKEKEQMIVQGGKGSEDDKKKYKKIRQTIEQQKKEHEALIQQQEQQQQEMFEIETKYQNVQEEVEKLRKLIKYLRKKLEEATIEQKDLQQEVEYQKEDMLETIRSQQKEIKLYAGMVKMMFSQSELESIQAASEWDEDAQEYKIPPFNFKAKKVNFPSLPYKQAMDLIELEKQERVLEINTGQQNNKSYLSEQEQDNLQRIITPRIPKKESQQKQNTSSQPQLDRGQLVAEKMRQNYQVLEQQEGKQRYQSEIVNYQFPEKKQNQKIILSPIDNKDTSVYTSNSQYIFNGNASNNNLSQISLNRNKKNINLQPLEQKPLFGQNDDQHKRKQHQRVQQI
ncbi:unnamed protein product (macronuclear) [Paramecium tetraurelia]|uniref:Kinesin-like protein n=1 Tax=Paramecium tetraurelia TaxID=5888 RepID=A0BQG9_PARTE|nr:uncharacterized protein GSPATT00031015001 [Paramecium tetraurelia]CAK60786.1 unnamed protein product [Paramecium tetraurelia]|eukprot:XP_001428184.1 hypothetical protein (macronuclear) [Paramecium tetraurelia strain d4-2]